MSVSDAFPASDLLAQPEQYLLSSEQPLSRVHDALLLDLDGTTYLGKIAAPNAPEGLAQAKAHGAHAMYLTNNSGRSPEVVAQHLCSIGIPTNPADILNSSQVAAYKAKELLPAGAKVLLIGAEGLYRAFEDSGFEIVACADDAPDAVIQGLSEQATWAQLSEGVLAIHNHSALHIATNLDATIPKERGPMIGNGSFVACISNATGSKPINCGKPEPTMFEIGAQAAHAQRPLAVGDRLDTDIAGAVAAHVPSFHVLTGVSLARDIMLAEPDRRPSYLGIDMLDLNTPHPQACRRSLHDILPALSGEADGHATDADTSCTDSYAWVCGTASAWLAHSDPADTHSNMIVRIADGSDCRDIPLNARDRASRSSQSPAPMDISLNEYRALVCALWEAFDSGVIRRDGVDLPEFRVRR